MERESLFFDGIGGTLKEAGKSHNNLISYIDSEYQLLLTHYKVQLTM